MSETDLPADLDFLSSGAKREWPRMAEALQKLGRFDPDLDRTALAMCCQVYGRWVEAVRIVEEEGMVFISDDGQVCWNPALEIARDALDKVREILAEFGLTPPL